MKKIVPILLTLLVVLLALLLIRPRWYLNLTKQVEISPQVGAALVERLDCRSCHVIGGSGALKAPNLDDVLRRETDETLYGWLSNPRGMRANTAMPNFHFSDSEIAAILAYLRSLP